jgi:altronate hydrolase
MSTAVVALTHGSGCGMDTHGEGMKLLRRTLGGYARHANFAGVLVIGLGCEANQISSLFGAGKPHRGPAAADVLDPGYRRHREDHRARHRHGRGMLPHANAVTRQPVPASHIVTSACSAAAPTAIRASPPTRARRRGRSARAPRRHGDPVGDARDLRRRAPADAPRVSRDVGEKLVSRIKWWEDYTTRDKAR